TTFEPGASDVLTQGFVERPFSTAFFATRPAAMSTDGFDVFVQLVMAAITTDPLLTSAGSALPSGAKPTEVSRLSRSGTASDVGDAAGAAFLGFASDGSASSNDFFAL